MKNILYTFIFALTLSISSHGAEKTTPTPLEIVKQRTLAHNTHDIEKFINLYSEEIKIYDYPDNHIGKQGKAHMRRIFEPLFSEKAVHADVHQMIENGNHVVVHETVVRENKTTIYLAIYEIRDGLIHNVRFIRDR
tara:strand:- start:549 stop:956 length:408 start_codon:yes stop_codon:yes gene_type:complete